MAKLNFEITRLYSLLFEIEQKITADTLPLAAAVGLNTEDAKLFESLEIAATDIREHLGKFELSIKETN